VIVLDNDIAVKFLRGDDGSVTSHLRQYSGEAWAIPSLVSFEFFQHYDRLEVVVQTRQKLQQVFDEILPFTAEVAVEAWRLDDLLESQGVSLEPLDLLNLATSRDVGATFVTHNKRDFDKRPLHDLVDVDVVYTSN